MLNQRSEQDTSASNKDGGIGTQIHLKLTQLVQNIFCVQLSRITNRLFYRIWQYRFLPLQHCTDMLVFNAHVVLRADFANDIIVHGDDSALQTAAELQIRLSVTKEKHIGSISADILESC